MTEHEQEDLEAFRLIRDHFSGGTCRRNAFVEIMGKIVQRIKALENIKYGCPTGIHASSCDCKPAVRGWAKTFQAIKNRKVA